MLNNQNNFNDFSNYVPDYSYNNPYEFRVGFGRRLAAYIIDYLIYTLLFIIALMLTGKIEDMMSISQFDKFDVEYLTKISESIVPLALIISLIYYSLEAFIGATLGKLTLGIKIGNSNREQANINQLLIRFLVKNINVIFSIIALIPALNLLGAIGSLLGFIVFIGCFFVLGQKKQALHDMIANTAVFYKDEIINNKME